jgi:predicted GIY-YIG superfamily endonuclease
MDQITSQYARMWPREVFYRHATKGKKGFLFRTIELLTKPGVYVLYRDDVPYYVGQATKLRTRLWAHACKPDGRYYNHWNYFSAFVIEDENRRNEIESILIAAMPTANSMKPLKKENKPAEITRMEREIRFNAANPPLNKNS